MSKRNSITKIHIFKLRCEFNPRMTKKENNHVRSYKKVGKNCADRHVMHP